MERECSSGSREPNFREPNFPDLECLIEESHWYILKHRVVEVIFLLRVACLLPINIFYGLHQGSFSKALLLLKHK